METHNVPPFAHHQEEYDTIITGIHINKSRCRKMFKYGNIEVCPTCPTSGREAMVLVEIRIQNQKAGSCGDTNSAPQNDLHR